jgi:hypothetical protein
LALKLLGQTRDKFIGFVSTTFAGEQRKKSVRSLRRLFNVGLMTIGKWMEVETQRGEEGIVQWC